MAVCQRLHSDVPGKLMKLNGLGDFNPQIWVSNLTNGTVAIAIPKQAGKEISTSLEPPVRENTKVSITIWFVPFPLVGMVT